MPVWDYTNPDFPIFKGKYDMVLETLYDGYIFQTDKKFLSTKEKIKRLKENRFEFLKKLHERHKTSTTNQNLGQTVKFEDPSDSYGHDYGYSGKPTIKVTRPSLKDTHSSGNTLTSSWRTVITAISESEPDLKVFEESSFSDSTAANTRIGKMSKVISKDKRKIQKSYDQSSEVSTISMPSTTKAKIYAIKSAKSTMAQKSNRTYVSSFRMSDQGHKLEEKTKKVDEIRTKVDENNQTLEESLLLAQDLKDSVSQLVSLLRSSQKARDKLVERRRKDKQKAEQDEINRSIFELRDGIKHLSKSIKKSESREKVKSKTSKTQSSRRPNVIIIPVVYIPHQKPKKKRKYRRLKELTV